MLTSSDASALTTHPHVTSQVASTLPAAHSARPDTVKAGLTPKRPGRQVENGAFVRRVLRAYAAAWGTATSRPWSS
jgi:hypothetical protein